MNAIVADDDEFFRLALASILKTRFSFQAVAETGSLDGAIDILDQKADEVGITFLDLSMPGMMNAGSLSAIRAGFPSVKVVIVSASTEREKILQALEAGAHGYIPKGLGAQEVANAIEVVLSSNIFVPATLAELPTGEFSRPFIRTEITQESLTPRQGEVLQCLVRGLSNKEIARTLGLGEGTVKVHVASLLRALGVENRAAAAALGATMIPNDRAAG